MISWLPTSKLDVQQSSQNVPDTMNSKLKIAIPKKVLALIYIGGG